ncbi:hypothetical protein C8R47DRAFT_1224924 [Mycena vitilis]|nr:hypothetical protein C8R47DRAFT_1224924 [Mycena vitilis]
MSTEILVNNDDAENAMVVDPPHAGPEVEMNANPPETIAKPTANPTEKQSENGDVAKKIRKKPGNKGDFHGQREAFLRLSMDEYWAASKKGKTRRFWPVLFAQYWSKFDWHLALNEEPGDRVLDATAKLSKEEEARKEKVVTETKHKIKTWFNHQRTAMGLSRNPFTPWLSRLRRPDDKKPKRITDYQYYMQHEKYKAAVNTEFELKHWDTPRCDHLARRCDVARAPVGVGFSVMHCLQPLRQMSMPMDLATPWPGVFSLVFLTI